MNNPVYLGLSTLDLSKTVMYEFWYDYVKPNYGGNFILWIQTASLFMQKQMMFTKTLLKKLKQDLTLQILNQKDHYLKEKIKKVIGLMKNDLSGQIMKEFVGLRAN